MYANIYSHVDQLGVYTFWDNLPNDGTNDPKHFFQAQLVQISVKNFLVFHWVQVKLRCQVWRGPLFFLYNMILVTGEGLGSWCYPCGSPSWVVHLSSWTWVLPFCFLFSLFFECFSQFMVGSVSSFRVSG